MGRPPVFETPEEFESAVEDYFDSLMSDEVPTVNGLALALGFNSRQSLLNYAEKPEFLDTVKRARTRLEMAWEKRLGGSNAAGTIFWLKNQGWTDKSTTEITGPDGQPVRTSIEVAFVERSD